ncbi:hypothetical protein [Henriciella marina]|uniref:Uncharacterized protein n=1 Tax=Henriciella marina TaxID=453851 RepID=A0ABT4LUL6_9PROT|nr:hypothetical protein [Henriciella marina]MCZ4298075.1 hypothetical protein [Henriciella marina]
MIKADALSLAAAEVADLAYDAAYDEGARTSSLTIALRGCVLCDGTALQRDSVVWQATEFAEPQELIRIYDDMVGVLATRRAFRSLMLKVLAERFEGTGELRVLGEDLSEPIKVFGLYPDEKRFERHSSLEVA